MIPETIGKRIARLRQQHGFTQEMVAAHTAISRVAVSHIEMDLTLPSERTICLLAGLFKLSPHTLVDGTTYPPAKAERLPPIVCCYTELELDLALLERDLSWLNRLEGCVERPKLAAQVRGTWKPKLAQWQKTWIDDLQQKRLVAAQQTLDSVVKP